MKNYFKYSMLITIVLLITTSLVNVQAPPNIGTTTQASPYESNPTATANFMVGAPLSTGKDAMKDGDLTSSGDFFLGAPHIIRPNGDGNYKAWAEVPAGAGFLAWYQESPDGDTTYVYTTTAAARESSTLDDPPADASGTITSVTVYVVAKRNTAVTTTITPFFRLGTTDLSGTSISLTTSTYTSFPRVIGRPGGGSWTWADITNLQAGVLFGAGTPRVTQLYVEVAGPTKGYFELNTFTNTPTNSFTIGFVDIKIKYNVPTALSDDKYNITYTTGTTWNTLQADTGDAYDRDTTPAIRPWSNVSEPTDSSWDWTDIGSLRIRVGVTATGAWDNLKMYIFEVWLSVYPLPLPPSGSAHLAVIPSGVYRVGASDYFFVDIYVTGVSQMDGYYLLLTFDNLTLTPDSAFIYDPFQYTSPATPELNDTMGWVIIQQSTYYGSAGFAGSEPVARIYFYFDQRGASKLDIINSTEFAGSTWPSGMSESKLKDIYAASISHTVHDGWVSSASSYLSAIDGSNNPTTVDISWPTVNNTKWNELYPTYSTKWRLTSLEDNHDGVLSESDQIDMLNETNYRYWFHVDVVTITIHWSNMSTGEYGAAEAVPPVTAMPTGDPSGTTWHVIYPAANFSKTITITSWIDSGSISGTFDPSDHFDFTYDDTPEVTHWAHLDYVSTDIVVSEKPIPPEHVLPPAVPEFPLGIEALMAIAPLITIIYLWRKRPKRRL